MYLEILKNLFFFSTVIIFLFIIGNILLSFFNYNRKLTYTSYFFTFLASVTFVIIVYSIFKTGFKTISIAFIPLIFVLIYKQKLNYNNLREVFKNISIAKFLICLFIAFIFFFYEAAFLMKNELFCYNIPYCDFTYYSDISSFLHLSGQENRFLLSNVYFDSFNGIVPYHYFELWLTGLISYLFNIPGIVALMQFVYPTFYFITFLGILALWEQFAKINTYKIILGFLLLFVGGVFFNFYKDYELLKYYSSSIASILYIWSKKIPPVFPFIILFFIAIKNNKLKLGLMSLLATCVVSIGMFPGIICGLILFGITNPFHKSINKKMVFQLLIYTLFFFLFFLLIYLLFGNRNSGEFGYKQIFNNFIESINSIYFKKILFGIIFPIIRYILFYSPFILIGILVFFKYKKEKKDISQIKIATIIFLSCFISGSIIGGISFNIFNASQFLFHQGIFLQVLIIFICISFLSEFTNIFSIFKNKITSLVFGLLITVLFYNAYNIITFNINMNKMNRREPFYSNTYLFNVTKYLNENQEHINRFGVAFMGNEDILKYPFTYFGTASLIFSGMSLKFTNDLYYTSNLSIFDVKVDTTDVVIADFFKAFEFYNFVKKQKIENSFISIDSSKVQFIKKYNIEFAIIYKDGKLPKCFENKIKYKIEDFVSGEKFVVFAK